MNSGHQMPDGSFLFAADGAAQAALAWAIEALKEFKQVNQRLKRIEKTLESIRTVDAG